MNYNELEAKLISLMSLPMKSQIKIDFDRDKQVFSLSVSVFRMGEREIPLSVQKYVQAREGLTFKPHMTSYSQVDNQIRLVQEIPFEWGFQPELREQVTQFWDMAKHCHEMLKEIAAEEKVELFKH
jgi:hypothetical protein